MVACSWSLIKLPFYSFIQSFAHSFTIHPLFSLSTSGLAGLGFITCCLFQALGLAGAADAVVGALQRHGVSNEVNRVMEMAADAIRSLCCLERYPDGHQYTYRINTNSIPFSAINYILHIAIDKQTVYFQ